MFTKLAILTTLESGHKAIADYVSDLPETIFFNGSDDHWSPAHHVGHLTVTHVNVARGFPLKDRLPAFDKPSRNYDEMKNAYLEALRNTPLAFLANNPFAVKLKSEDTQEKLIDTFMQKGKEVRDIDFWSENDLDTKGMRHPILGLLSVREMLEFVAIHDLHHLSGIKNLIKKA